MTERSITPSQFFSLLYLCMLGNVFMYISSAQITVASTDSLLRPLVFIVVSIAAVLPLFYICKKNDVISSSQGLLKNEGGAFYKIIAVIYTVVYIVDGIMTCARFDLFASSELFPGTDMTFFIIALVGVCGALSLLGIGALARGSVVFTIVVVGATLFAMLTLIKEIDFLHFTPLFENGVGDFFKDSLVFSVQGSEIGAVLLLLPHIKGKIVKNYVLWAVLGGLSFSFVLFFVIGTLGIFADTQLFPTYAAVTLAEFGLLERLDALETAIWILCVVSKLTLYIMIALKCIRYAFPKLSAKAVAAAFVVIISGVLVFVSGDIKKFAFVSYMPLVCAVYIIPVIILPVAVLVAEKIKRGQKGAKGV